MHIGFIVNVHCYHVSFLVLERQTGCNFVIQALPTTLETEGWLSVRQMITFNLVAYLVILYVANPTESPSALRFQDLVLRYIWLLYTLRIQLDCVDVQEYWKFL